MNDFNKDNEFSIKVRPLVDDIYNYVFKAHKKINRIKYNEEFILDTKFHIDVILSGNYGQITLQEKTLRHEFSHYNTLTMEYMQNRHTNETGEFFNLCSQFYFSGYINEEEDKFDKWIIINIPVFMAYPSILIPHKIKPSTSNASFICWEYKNIPQECIYDSFNIITHN